MMQDRVPPSQGKQPTVHRDSDIAQVMARRAGAGALGQMQLQLSQYEESYGITSMTLHRRVLSGTLGAVPQEVAWAWNALYGRYQQAIRAPRGS